jgi:serine/threonine-protein kinase
MEHMPGFAKEWLTRKTIYLSELNFHPELEHPTNHATPLSLDVLPDIPDHLGPETQHDYPDGGFTVEPGSRYAVNQNDMTVKKGRSGGYGAVVFGKDTIMEREVAIKFMRPDRLKDYYDSRTDTVIDETPEMIRRFYREARILAGMRHPNIARVHDIAMGEVIDTWTGERRMVPGMVMERLENLPTKMKMKDIRRLAVEVASGLQYAHDHQMLHFDVKPANIMKRPGTGEFVLTDFGAAHMLDGSQGENPDIHTKSYSDPQRRGDSTETEYPERADQYALALSVYELITGEDPEEGVIRANDWSELKIPLEMDPRIMEVLTKATSHSRNDRYESCAAFAAALEEAMDAAEAAPVSALTLLGKAGETLRALISKQRHMTFLARPRRGEEPKTHVQMMPDDDTVSDSIPYQKAA